jgi:hypothetical protein
MIIEPDFKAWIAFCYEPINPVSTEAFQFRNCFTPCVGIDDKPNLITSTLILELISLKYLK